MICAPRSAAGTFAMDPLNLPTAVRSAAVMTTSSIDSSSVEIPEFDDRLTARSLLNQLLNHARIRQGRNVPELIVFVGGDLAKNSPHDLAGARFRKPWRPLDDIRRCDRTNFLADPSTQLSA